MLRLYRRIGCEVEVLGSTSRYGRPVYLGVFSISEPNSPQDKEKAEERSLGICENTRDGRLSHFIPASLPGGEFCQIAFAATSSSKMRFWLRSSGLPSSVNFYATPPPPPPPSNGGVTIRLPTM